MYPSHMRLVMVLAILAAAITCRAADPPNIIFIMADDHAYHALSCYGSQVNTTPNLDRIATSGLRFDRAFVTNSICTPSRATILTSKYSHLNGVPVFNRFDGSQETAPKLLQAAGYHTGMIGKWHLGSDPTGFDRWVVLPGQGAYVDPWFLTPDGTMQKHGHVTSIITDLGIDFLDHRPHGKPFFLMLHHKAPHRNWIPDEANARLFAERRVPEPDTLFDTYGSRPAALPGNRQTIARDLTPTDLKQPPPAGLAGDDMVRWKYQRYMQDYLACVQGIDDQVGRLLDYLDSHDLAKNTVIFYTSDNGFFLGDLGLYDKRFMYEPGLRVPLLVRYPGVASPGATCDLMALNIDIAPTFLDIAGLPIPADMQGRSLLPLMKSDRPADWRTSMYYRYYHDPGDHNTRAHYGVRTATHKLIYYWKQEAWELFDLIADPHEQNNRAGDPSHREVLEILKAELARLRREFKDEDQFAAEQPPPGVDGPFPQIPGKK